MKVLFCTERTPAVSKDLGFGHPAAAGITWFELVLHEGPPDENTSEGGGQTVAYWRTQFARKRNPRPWTIQATGVEEGVAPAVIPDDIVSSLPEDARISLGWTFLPDAIAKSSGA